MNQKNSLVRVITIKDLVNVFVQRLVIIILVMVASIGVLYLINAVTYEPQYSSTATIYILRQGNDSSTTDTNNDFSLALSVVNDCTYLLKSHTVLDEVIQNLSLEMPYEELYKKVTTRNPEDTRVLEVTVTADSPEEAKKIVDEICLIGSENIEDAMGFRQVNLYEYGTLDSNPSNKMRLRTYAIVGLLSGILMYLIFVIVYMFDDRLRTDEEIEKTLGVSILGEIPNANHGRKGKYGYSNKYYKAYGAGTKKKKSVSGRKKKAQSEEGA